MDAHLICCVVKIVAVAALEIVWWFAVFPIGPTILLKEIYWGKGMLSTCRYRENGEHLLILTISECSWCRNRLVYSPHYGIKSSRLLLISFCFPDITYLQSRQTSNSWSSSLSCEYEDYYSVLPHLAPVS